MSDRVVKIKLDADANGAVKGFAAVRDAAGETRAKVAESMKSQRQEWATVGAGLTAAGVAITGLGVAVMKTGIEYNTLQQTSRAALTTILGSAQAANAQMDKLDAFARNSPFAKQTFITAQQQMLAFGIETQKVIPYLDALQNAVAASGGSNQDIAELAEIFGKVQSAAKITSVDLQMFGRRGVNAAELIGAQMGKTGAEIRSEITAGTLDASKALDALAKGMDQKYSGAAANVKNTFAGAMDRVKAAWRDFAAELAKPLVDPNGGGALVDLLNWTADAMRNFQALPEPVKATAAALTGLTGVTALLAGGTILGVQAWMRFSEALKVTMAALSPAMGAMRGAVAFLTGPWGLALTAAAAVATVFFMENQKLVAQGREFADTLDDQTGAITENSRAWAANKLQQDGVLSAAKRLGISASEMTDAWLGNADAIEKVTDRISRFYSDTDFRMANTDGNDNWFRDLAKLERTLDGSSTVLAEAKTRHDELAEATNQTAEATGSAVGPADGMSVALQGVHESATDAWKGVSELVDALNEFNGVGQSAEQANSRLQDAFAKVEEHVQQVRDGVDGASGALDEWTVAGSSNRAMLAGLAADVEKNAAAQFELEKQTLGAAKAVENYEGRLAAGRQKILDMATAMSGNADEAQKLTDKIAAIPSQKDIQILLKGAKEAEGVLSDLSRYRETTIGIRTVGEKGTQVRANGGTIGFASGGTIPGFTGGRVMSRRHIAGPAGGVFDGTVYGAGTAKSDSIPVRLSKGEEVIQEPFASMFRPELKAINRGVYLPSTPPPVIVQAPGGSGSGGVHIGSVELKADNPRDQMRELQDRLDRLGR